MSDTVVRQPTVRCPFPAVIAALLLSVLPARAVDSAAVQPPDSARASRLGIGKALLSDLRLTGRDAVRWMAAPVRWRQREWTGLALLAGTGALVVAGDRVAGQMAAAVHNDGAARVLSPFEYYGRRRTVASVAGVLYLGGLLSRSEQLRQTGRCAVVALLLSAALSSVVNEVVGRARPSTDEGPASFDPFSFTNAYHSMPSGHTTAAFALSSVLACRIDHPIASVALYAAAALTAVQRVYSGRHWPSDVVAGAVIGTATGVLVARGAPAGQPGPRRRRVALAPVSAGTASGCGVAIAF